MKSLTLLWKKMAADAAIWCSTSATRDIKYATRRVEHEGLSFLTITLPTFGKDIEKCLDLGYVDRNLFMGFPWQAGLPRFLGGFLDLVFDRNSGELLPTPSIDAIIAIRQLTLAFSKILLPSSDARTKAAMDGYVQCEVDVRASDARISDQQWSDFDRIAHLLFGRVFSEVDQMVFDRTLLPKHGPGATADRLSGNAKYRQSEWPSRLEQAFPAWEYLLPNGRFSDRLESMTSVEPGSERPVRVITVPKTLKTPRIIGIEPTAMQYSQQALLNGLLSAISKDGNLRRMIGFKDQDVNNRLAQEGSLFGDLATLDLSEASDRVSNQHVRRLLANHLCLHEAVDSCRSRKADVPGHGIIRMAKFASMGSALCFPMEAMVFLTIILIGIEKDLDSPMDEGTVKRLRRQVRVYGDDIIIPVRHVQSVIDSLESFGMKVNRNKSFWNGKFRESCGKEYYNGHDVSIVRVRRVLPTSLNMVQEVLSIVPLRNQLYLAGYWQSARWLDVQIERVLKHFPNVESTSPVLGRLNSLGYHPESWDDDTFAPRVRGARVSVVIPKDKLSGVDALTKCLLRMESRVSLSALDHFPQDDERWSVSVHGVDGLPTVDDEHLDRAGRPQVRIKLRQGSPF